MPLFLILHHTYLITVEYYDFSCVSGKSKPKSSFSRSSLSRYEKNPVFLQEATRVYCLEEVLLENNTPCQLYGFDESLAFCAVGISTD